jgi:hypothetical protein
MAKVKLIAIAKDESAYLADWLFHHINAGFAEIEVILNRTTDASVELIDEISGYFPNVSRSRSDFVDWVPGGAHTKMQQIAYALAYQKLIDDNSSDFTHVMYLDIDEYWIHTNLETKIADFVDSLPHDKGISFSWLNDVPSSTPFETVTESLTGTRTRLVKSVFPLTAGLRVVRAHQPLLKNHRYQMANGEPFIPDENIDEHSVKSVYQPAFIYHRFLRSPMEYVSSLYRGDPKARDIPLKGNRSGLPNGSVETLTVPLDDESFQRYKEHRSEFFKLGKIQEITNNGEKFVYERYKEALGALSETLPVAHEKMLKVFTNVPLPEIEEVFANFHDSLIAKYENKVELIRDLAIKVEGYSIAEAKRIMLIAQSLRPDGPRINAKIDEYNQKLI